MRLGRDVADLVLGRACLACDAPGPSLCAGCLQWMRRQPHQTASVAGLDGLAACGYRGTVRRAVLDYKQHADRSLARPLGRLLADAVLALEHDPGLELDPGDRRSRLLVPIPAHRRSRRGFDALGAICEHAAGCLAHDGSRARVERLLLPGTRYPPLKDLGRRERQQRVRGAFTAIGPARDADRSALIVVDDVLTTGATIGEAIRTLVRVGHRVVGFATVAAVVPSGADGAGVTDVR
jgi:predicted amidophosphoribosyltransferase